MKGEGASGRTEPTPEELESYLRLTPSEIVRLVLCLLIGEALQGQVAELLPDS
jgi:hypothetical protein